MDTQTLIGRCKAGEREALHLLYERYRPRLLSICRQYAKGDDIAEDLLHDAFVIILTSLSQLRNDDKLESWMTTIVRNVGYHYKQHIEREQAALKQMAADSLTVTDAGMMPDFEQLQKLVAQLPSGYQQVFRLSVFEGLSHQEIGSLLGIAPHSSSSQLSHAKRMLQILMKQSWVLILLLIAIPTVVWKFFVMERETELRRSGEVEMGSRGVEEPQVESVIEPLSEKAVRASAEKRSSTHPKRFQAEAVITPDSMLFVMEEHADTLPVATPALVGLAEEHADTLPAATPALVGLADENPFPLHPS